MVLNIQLNKTGHKQLKYQ